MRYLCLVYIDEHVFETMSEREDKQLTNDALDYDDELRSGGHYITSAPLASVNAASTVRVRNGKISATDGPFAETKEHLGGFIMIEARDLNEAIQLAAKIPMARIGSIEVRPMRQIERTDLDA